MVLVSIIFGIWILLAISALIPLLIYHNRLRKGEIAQVEKARLVKLHKTLVTVAKWYIWGFLALSMIRSAIDWLVKRLQ